MRPSWNVVVLPAGPLSWAENGPAGTGRGDLVSGLTQAPPVFWLIQSVKWTALV